MKDFTYQKYIHLLNVSISKNSAAAEAVHAVVFTSVTKWRPQIYFRFPRHWCLFKHNKVIKNDNKYIND